MADEFETTIRMFPELEQVSSSDIFYSVSKVDTVDTDFKVTAAAVRNFILGTAQIAAHEIGADSVISVVDNNVSKLCTIGDFEKRLLGSTALTAHESLSFRAFKPDGTRGNVSMVDIFNFVNIEEDVVEAVSQDISTVSVRLFIENERVVMNIQNFRNWLIGPTTFTTIKDTDNFHISSNSNKNGVVSFDTLVSHILPSKRFISDEVVTDNLRLYATSTERGYITLGTTFEYIVNKLSLPKYDNGDEDVTENVLFPYYLDDNSGKMSRDKLYSILFKDSIEELDDDTLIRSSNGVVVFSSIKDSIYDYISESFKIGIDDIQSNINDGDTLVFIQNGDVSGKYNGITFNTIKEKILDFDTALTADDIEEFDKIYIEKDDGTKGHILYKDLRDKLQLDLYGQP